MDLKRNESEKLFQRFGKFSKTDFETGEANDCNTTACIRFVGTRRVIATNPLA